MDMATQDSTKNQLIMDFNNLKLTIELVPTTSWYCNLRKVLPLEAWDKLRHQVYAQYNHQCGICGQQGILNCHELWQYDDLKYIQTLTGFIALCKMCHHIKHIGLANILADRGELNYEMLIRHFMGVNNCDRLTFTKHRQKAFDEWERRSEHEWQVDLNDFKKYLITNYQKMY